MAKKYEVTFFDLGMESFTEDMINPVIEVGNILTLQCGDQVKITNIRLLEPNDGICWSEAQVDIDWVQEEGDGISPSFQWAGQALAGQLYEKVTTTKLTWIFYTLRARSPGTMLFTLIATLSHPLNKKDLKTPATWLLRLTSG